MTINIKSNNISIYPGAVRNTRVREYLPVRRILFMSKQAGTLKAIGVIANPVQVNKTVLAQNPFSGLSTFFGYYMVQARLAGDYGRATEAISATGEVCLTSGRPLSGKILISTA